MTDTIEKLKRTVQVSLRISEETARYLERRFPGLPIGLAAATLLEQVRINSEEKTPKPL